VWECTENVVAISSQDGTDQTIPLPTQLYRTLFIENRESLLGNCSLGQLTSIGEQQTRSLGQHLRQVLIEDLNLISPTYNSTQVYVRASDTPRCIQTARNILDGLFPPTQRESALVIPIWLVEKKTDDMQISFKSCPAALEAVIRDIIKPENLIQLIEPLVLHYEQLKKIYETSRPIVAALKNYDNCNCRVKHNISLPNGMNMNVFDAVQKSYWFGGQVVFNSTAALTVGPFAQELLDFMDQKISGNLSYSYQLFSGHDTTVGPMLSLMGIYNGVWPPYASHIELSLLQDSTSHDYFVQVTYDGSLMKLPGCGYAPLCPYESFKQLIVSQLPTNNACALLPGNRNEQDVFDIIYEYLSVNGYLKQFQ